MVWTKYSSTPSSNTAAPPDGAPEGMAASTVNNTMRDMMAEIRILGDSLSGSGITWGGTAGGTANALTITPSPAITAYAAGQVFRFISGAAANSGAATLNVNGVGAVNIRKKTGSTALVAGDIPASTLMEVVHDGTQFILRTVASFYAQEGSVGAPSYGFIGHSTGFYYAGSATLGLSGGVATTALFAGSTTPVNYWKFLSSDTGTPLEVQALGTDTNISINLTPKGTGTVNIGVASNLSGLGLSNDGSSPNTVLDIAAGVATSSDYTTHMALSSAYTKTTGSWAVGTGNGGLDTGSVGANATYFVYLIKRPDTGVVDVLFSASASSPTMPTNYTKSRRIGAFKTDGSNNIRLFYQSEDLFLWKAPTQSINVTTADATAHLAAVDVPSGIEVEAILSGTTYNGSTAGSILWISSPNQTDAAASSTNFTSQSIGTSNAMGFHIRVLTDTSAQIRYRAQNTSQVVTVNTNGWVDRRGK